MRRARGRIGVLLALATSCVGPARSARAETPPLPEQLHVTLERCEPLPFDAEAFLHALHVELFSLGVAEVSAGQAAPELHISAPGCSSELVLRLRRGPSERQVSIRTDELPLVGRDRALALILIEYLLREWPVLAETAPAPAATSTAVPSAAPLPVPERVPTLKTAAAPPAARGAAPSQPGRHTVRKGTASAHARGQGALSAGLRLSTEAPLASLGLTLDRSMSRAFALGGALAWRTEHAQLATDTVAYSMTFGPRVELSMLRFEAFELAAALGLAAGAGWIVTNRTGLSEARVSSSPAPLGIGSAALGVRARLAWNVFLQTGLTVDVALLGARFETRRGQRLADLGGARFGAFVGAGSRFGG